MKRYVLSILVNNHSGVLRRVSGLFSRRGYNIDSLSVGATENQKFARLTIVVTCDEDTVEQIQKQVSKLFEVKKVELFSSTTSVYRELLLVKVATTKETRAEILEIADIFRAKVVDVAEHSLIVELTGDRNKLSAFLRMLGNFEIIELSRTGLTALKRGEKPLRDIEQ